MNPGAGMSSESERIFEENLETVVSASGAMPMRSELQGLLQDAKNAEARGYYLPDEDERLRDKYRYYLVVRSVLLDCVKSLEPYSDGKGDWRRSIEVFTVAFTAACVLMRAAEFVVDLAGDRFLVWKKLDEAESRFGIERGSFSKIYKSLTKPRRALRYYEATRFYEVNAEEILSLAGEGGRMAELIRVLRSELPFMKRKKAEYLKRQLHYRKFVIKRRQHSGYRKVMFHMFQMSGRAIAEMKQPFIAMRKAGKRVTPRVLAKVSGLLQPGDVIITRHDDALSNLFLPGFWPHAAFYMGSAEQRAALGLVHQAPAAASVVEAKKDGVHFRRLEETLAVDAFVVLRPTMSQPLVKEAVEKAMSHVGKRYDFVFDFRQADRLACTEVVYRAYQAVGAMEFSLLDYAGRQCLPAESLIDQAVASGQFEPVAIYGVGGIKMLQGCDARRRLDESYSTAKSRADQAASVK